MKIEIIRMCLTLMALGFVAYISLRSKQDAKFNWAIFYSVLYVAVSLPLVNFICVKFDLWKFTPTNSIEFPFDIYFFWIVIWGIVPIFFLYRRCFFIVLLVIVWLDIVIMPYLESLGVLQLGSNWIYGEMVLVLTVFVPGYWWAYYSFYKTKTWLRALLQVSIMSIIVLIELPYILYLYGLIPSIEYSWSPLLFQFFLIISFPGLIAVQDLVLRGKGTPFPYDPTSIIVRNGVYGYCRNPIQWSFTFIFIPLSIYHSSYYFLIGSLVSIAYAFGVSDFQEYPDMQKRFGEKWLNYKKTVPKWYFRWIPQNYPKGIIYFDMKCNQCSQISDWFRHRATYNLSIKDANNYDEHFFLNVTYIDSNGNEFKSVEAIAYAMEHINLAYASLAWFMRFMPINFVLQAIVDSMGINRERLDSYEK